MLRSNSKTAVGVLVALVLLLGSAEAQTLIPPSGAGGGAPSGAAGGDLSGTYPNPTVVAAAGNFTVGGNATVNGLLSAGVAGSAVGQLRFFNATSGLVRLQPPTGALGNVTLTLPAVSSTVATVANTLGDFATTTSAQLAAVVSDETGSGLLTFATSPTLTAPTLSGITVLPGSGAIDASGNLGIGMTPVNPIDVTANQNAPSRISVMNNSGLGAATASFRANNGTNSLTMTMLSTGFTPNGPSKPDTALISSNSAAGGLALATGVAQPISFYISNAPAMQLNAVLTASKPVYTDASLNLTSTAPAGFSAVLSGTTAAIGGGALTPGACVAGTVTVTGATSAMVATASPSADPDSVLSTGIAIYSFVSSANTVTVRICAIVAVTPSAVTYNVRVLQ